MKHQYTYPFFNVNKTVFELFTALTYRNTMCSSSSRKYTITGAGTSDVAMAATRALAFA